MAKTSVKRTDIYYPQGQYTKITDTANLGARRGGFYAPITRETQLSSTRPPIQRIGRVDIGATPYYRTRSYIPNPPITSRTPSGYLVRSQSGVGITQSQSRTQAMREQLNLIRPQQIPVRRAKKGFKGVVSKPTYLLVGEGGKEKVSVKPIRNGLRRIQKRKGTRKSKDFDFMADFDKMMYLKMGL